LTTTQRMKEFRTAHSESVVKEREREPSRPNQNNQPSPFGRRGLPSRSTKETTLSARLRAPRYGAAPFAFRAKAGGPR